MRVRVQLEALLSDIKQASWEKDLELRPQTAEILRCGRDITKSYLSLTNIVSSYNEVSTHTPADTRTRRSFL